MKAPITPICTKACQSIASDVSGRVVKSAVADNATVRKGDVLFQLDPQPLTIALAAADAALAGARLSVAQMKAAYAQNLAQEDMARNEVAFRQSEYDRQAALADRGVATGGDAGRSRNTRCRSRRNS